MHADLGNPTRAKSRIPSARAPALKLVGAKKKSASKMSNTSRSNFVPPLSLPMDTLTRFEQTPRKATGNVSMLLSDHSGVMSPRSIREFISDHGNEASRNDGAMVIQRTWRVYRMHCKLRHVVGVFKKIRMDRERSAFHCWRLAHCFPGDLARKSYNVVSEYMIAQSVVVKYPKGWITTGGTKMMLDFNGYMSTGFLLVKPNTNVAGITLFRYLMYRTLIRKCLIGWAEIADGHQARGRMACGVQTLVAKRSLFGAEFNAFEFWRRWARYKKIRVMEKYTEEWLPEWSWFRASKTASAKRKAMADDFRVHSISRRVSIAFIGLVGKAKRVDETTIGSLRLRRRTLLSTVFRGLRLIVIWKKMKSGILRRCFRSWYVTIDHGIMTNMNKTVMRERTNLQILGGFFLQWRKNIFAESIRMVYLHEIVTTHRLLFMKTMRLMLSDHARFGFYTAFQKWHGLIEMRHRSLVLVQWSLSEWRDVAFNRIIFDIFRENAGVRPTREKYIPFRREGERSFLTVKAGHASRIARRQKLMKAVEIGKREFVLNVIPTCINDVINVVKYWEDAPRAERGWVKTATREQVRTLMFRLIVIMANKSRLNRYEMTPEEKVESLRTFKCRHFIYSRLDLTTYQKSQNASDLKWGVLMKRRFKHDDDRLMSLETHDAAVALQKHITKFTVRKIPEIESLPEVVDDEEHMSSKNPLDPTHRRRSLRPNPTNAHPMLQPIDRIKKRLKTTNRKYRRPPEEIFRVVEGENLSGAPVKAPRGFTRKQMLNSETGYTYEPFTSVPKWKPKRGHEKRAKQEQIDQADVLLTAANVEEPVEEPEKDEDSELLVVIPHKNELEGRLEARTWSVQNSDSFGAILGRSPSPIMSAPDREPKPDPHAEVNVAQLARNFVDDSGFFDYPDSERVQMMASKYFGVLDVLLGKAERLTRPTGQTGVKKKQPNEATGGMLATLRTNIAKFLKRAGPEARITDEPPKEEPRQTRAQKRKKLFEDPDMQFDTVEGEDGVVYQKSACPTYREVLFGGRTVLTKKLSYNNATTTSRGIPQLEEPPKGEQPDDDVIAADDLAARIEEFVQGSMTSVDDPEELLESLRDSVNMSTSDQQRVMLLSLINSIAKRYLIDETKVREASEEVEVLVDVKNSDMMSVASVVEIPPGEIEERAVPSSWKPMQEVKRHAAFPTSARSTAKGIEVIERELAFTRDLASSIREASVFARPLVMRYYRSVDEIEPFRGMSELQANVKKLLRPKPPEPEPEPEPELESTDPLTISGLMKRKKTQKAKPAGKAKHERVKPMTGRLTRTHKHECESLSLELSVESGSGERPKTELGRRPVTSRLKPRVTKMTPTAPTQPANFDIARPKTASSVRRQLQQPVKFKWNVEPDVSVTDEDLDFFMFVTPYVCPPEVINMILDGSG